jgi:hypothetical protein
VIPSVHSNCSYRRAFGAHVVEREVHPLILDLANLNLLEAAMDAKRSPNDLPERIVGLGDCVHRRNNQITVVIAYIVAEIKATIDLDLKNIYHHCSNVIASSPKHGQTLPMKNRRTLHPVALPTTTQPPIPAAQQQHRLRAPSQAYHYGSHF